MKCCTYDLRQMLRNSFNCKDFVRLLVSCGEYFTHGSLAELFVESEVLGSLIGDYTLWLRTLFCSIVAKI